MLAFYVIRIEGISLKTGSGTCLCLIKIILNCFLALDQTLCQTLHILHD